MASTNRKTPTPHRTHEGAPAYVASIEGQLKRSVLTCMLWENSFYEDGVGVAKRIKDLTKQVGRKAVAVMKEAKHAQKIRHAPLWIAVSLLEEGDITAEEIVDIITRPDDMTELLSLWWLEGKRPIPNQLKKALAMAFHKFDAYQIAKYNQKKDITLRDVMFLSHPKPKDDVQATLFQDLANGTLASPDTWEVALSGGAGKKETFTRLLNENKLGALAFLRNLRNMLDSGVSEDLIVEKLAPLNVSKILPFQFLTAAKFAPQLEPFLEHKMYQGLKDIDVLPGKTVLLVDRSGSMEFTISGKSILSRFDAACGLAILVREICEHVDIFTFTTGIDGVVERIPPRHGFALKDAMQGFMGGTPLGVAIRKMNDFGYDRLIVITDEQSHDSVGSPLPGTFAYMVNIAPYEKGVGYGKWHRINGWSESLIKYISEFERSLTA